MKKLFTISLITLISFQMAFAETILRIPAQYDGHEISIEDLTIQLKAFKIKIKGEEKTQCPEAELPGVEANSTSAQSESQAKIDYYLSRLEKNACSEARYSLDPKEQKEEKCTVEKTLGLLDVLVEKTIDAERNEQEVAAFRLDDLEVRELHKEAEYLKSEVRKYLYNNKIDRAQRVEILVSYLDSVVLQMRDLIVTKRSYMDEQEYDGTYFYRQLLPEFPGSLIRQEDAAFVDKITMGPNPSTEPFHLSIVDRGMGRKSLEFREMDIISRDIVTLLKAPTKLNYIRALKWMTLQMMISQVALYNTMIGEDTEVAIPRSCSAHFNGDLPSTLKMQLNESTGNQYIEGLLSNHGLVIDASNYQFIEYYMDNVSKDPLKDGYSGLFPFEEYALAKQAVESKEWHRALKPHLDDITHFETALQIKLPEASDVFRGEVRISTGKMSGRRPVREKRKMTMAGSEQFHQIVSEPSPYDMYELEKDGYTYTLDPQRQNLSTFMAESMQRKGYLDFQELISDSLKKTLKSKKIKIDFPSLYGAHIWRGWSLELLANVFEQKASAPANDKFVSYFQQVCSLAPGLSGVERRELCGNRNTNNLSKLSEKLATYRNTDEYVPLRRLEESNYKSYYPLFDILWRYLRDQTDLLPEATTNEYDLLVDQMQALNPWARVRLGYLIAKDEMVQAKDGYTGTRVSTARGSRRSAETQCFYTQIEERIERLEKAAKKLGVTKTFNINYSDSLLSDDEKEFIWGDTLDQTNEGNSRLFTEVLSGESSYNHLEDLSYKTLLSRDQVEKASRELPFALSGSELSEIDEVLNSNEGKLGEFLFKLYSLKGQTEKQKVLFEQYSLESGLSSEGMAKLSFLILDSSLKKPLMKRVVREAAHSRRDKVLEQMDKFCDMEPTDHEALKALFYATTKAQNQINQLAGLQGVPEELIEKINSLSPEEWVNIGKGVGAGLLAIGAIVLTGVCAGVTGGACLVISPMIVGAAISGLALQADLVRSEYKMKKVGDEHATKIKFMEDLGFTDSGSSSELSRSWAWTILEGIFMIPIIGVVGRAGKVSAKMAYVSAQAVLNKTTSAGFKEIAKTTIAEADVRTARYLLGMDNLGDAKTLRSLGRVGAEGDAALKELNELLLKEATDPKVVAKAMEDMDKVRHLFASGRISMDEMIKGMARSLDPLKTVLRPTAQQSFMARQFGSVTVGETKTMIDRRTAEVVSSYFGNNPAAMNSLLKTYTGKRLSNAAKLLNKVETRQGVMRVPVLGSMVGWFRKLRHEALLKNADKLRHLEAETAKAVMNGGDLESVIVKNIDDFTEVFMNIPMRKREMPYLFIIQGSPMIGGSMAGSRVPVLGAVADGIVLRKFFTARARLVYESFKTEARQILALPKTVGAEGGYVTFKAFQHSLFDSLDDLSEEQARLMMNQYNDLESKLSQKLHANIVKLKKDGKTFKFKEGTKSFTLNAEEIKRVVFNPKTIEEKALGESIWSASSVDELFELKEMGDVAHKLVQDLAQYKDVDQFQKFLNAMKIVVLNGNPGRVEVF